MKQCSARFFSPLIASADSCSFFFLSLFLSLYLSAIFPFTCNFMWFIKLRASADISGYVWGVRECVWVCESVRGGARVCVDMHGCGMYFQNFLWRIESLHQRTLIRFLYEFFTCTLQRPKMIQCYFLFLDRLEMIKMKIIFLNSSDQYS